MPGFGSGPFGGGAFGEWGWARRVFFDSLPEIHRQQDAAQDRALEKWAATLQPSFDHIRHKIRDFLDVCDPFEARTQYDETRTLRLGPVVNAKGELEQRGLTGSVDSLQRFVASTARFASADLGKELTVFGSSIQGNNRKVVISFIVNSSTVVVDPLLTTDAGPLTWELRPRVDPSTSTTTVEVREGYVNDVAPGWILFDGFASFKVVGRRQFKDVTQEQRLLTEQEGQDGEIDGSGRFKAASASFTQRDVGKKLSLHDALVPTNSNTFEITSLVTVGPGDVRAELDAAPVLTASASLHWARLPFAELDLEGIAVPEGVVEQEGVDLTVTAVSGSDATVSALSAVFTAADVGKYLTVRGSELSNDGTAIVTEFVSTTSLKVAQKSPAFVVEALAMTWELRTATREGDLSQVTVRASSLVADLAPSFGIEVDTQESEIRQRGWVAHVNQWLDKKGTFEGYRIVGALSGFDVTALPLFRISSTLFPTIPDDHEFEVGETAVGKSGVAGTLSLVGSKYRLEDPAAAFAATDVDKHIRVRDAANGGNNKRYTIETIVNATTVEFVLGDTATLPDANNGSLDWSLIRVYTDLEPRLPLYDEIRGDLLTDIIADTSGGFFQFSADRYCWEEDFDTTVHVEVLSVTTTAPGVHTVTVVGNSTYPDLPEVVVGIGNWKLMSLAAAGVAGTGDSFAVDLPTVTLTDVGAAFSTDLVGKWIRIVSATSGDNNGTFLITEVPNATTLKFINGLGVAEAFAGTYSIFTPTDFFLTTIPVLTGGTHMGLPIYSFEVRASIPPTSSGPGKLRYVCPVVTSCDYCQARQVYAIVEPRPELLAEGGQAVDRVLERLLIRLQDVTPAHVELIVLYRASMTATAVSSATVDPTMV